MEFYENNGWVSPRRYVFFWMISENYICTLYGWIIIFSKKILSIVEITNISAVFNKKLNNLIIKNIFNLSNQNYPPIKKSDQKFA